MTERATRAGRQESETQTAAVPCRRTLFFKRTLDLLLVTITLLVTLPLALVVALAIRMDTPGPALFRQERVGQGGVSFHILKFRTMYHNVAEDLHKIHVELLVNDLGRESLSIRLENDHRITPVGRFLRRWSLDELPNLWNVFKGEMSVVGPRPLVPYEIDALGPEAHKRLAAKPGVTGLAQVNGRLDHDVDARTDHDLAYVEHVSLWTDIAVICRTPSALLSRRGV